MTKPTLDDFYARPRQAYKNGFRLKWSHSIIHVVKFTFIYSWLELFKLSVNAVFDYTIPLAVSFLKMTCIVLVVVTMPILFPLWVVIHQLELRKIIKQYFGDGNND